jgi:hypothetical protein
MPATKVEQRWLTMNLRTKTNIPSLSVYRKAARIMATSGFLRLSPKVFTVSSGSREGVLYTVTIRRTTRFTLTASCPCEARAMCAHILVAMLAQAKSKELS